MLQRQKFFVGALVLAAFAALTLPVLADELKGKIATINPQKNEFTVEENVKNWKFQLVQGGSVIINDRPGTLAELKAGDDAVVIYSREGERLIASAVRCKRK